jgi:hypothetical protein
VVDVGDDGKVANVLHRVGQVGGDCIVLDACVRAACAGLYDGMRERPRGVFEGFDKRLEKVPSAPKKRRVQDRDAPSNRTFGNCLLGDHSIQKDRPGTRANA